jgi:hypothetical protein
LPDRQDAMSESTVSRIQRVADGHRTLPWPRAIRANESYCHGKVGLTGSRLPVSGEGGGLGPLWRRDGRGLHYSTGDGRSWWRPFSSSARRKRRHG